MGLHRVDYREGNVKQQLSSIVRTCLNRYKCSSYGEFRTLLEAFNISVEERTGTIDGRNYAGVIYGALTDDGYGIGTPFKSRGVCPNTSSYYMRGLRAIYNRAVEKGMTVQRDPFKYVYTGIGKTVKRAVPLKVIRRIRDMDLALFPAMDFARDIFMFSFYTRGMSFIDMAYLKKKDLQNGILSYRRQKTGQQLFVKWEKPMQEIVDKYDTVSTPYLLPVIKDMNADARRQYKNAAHLVNDKLKKLGVRLGLDIPLTSYVARHGWASIARSRNIPLATISEAMGHDSEKTTRIYLASLDTSSVDKANSQILKAL